jgi:hypothetical protein
LYCRVDSGNRIDYVTRQPCRNKDLKQQRCNKFTRHHHLRNSDCVVSYLEEMEAQSPFTDYPDIDIGSTGYDFLSYFIMQEHGTSVLFFILGYHFYSFASLVV